MVISPAVHLRPVPGDAEPPAVLADEPYRALLAHPAFEHIANRRRAGSLCNPFRDAYLARFGFVVLSRETLDTLARLLRDARVLEVGAGSGYLASRLAARGTDVLACDRGGQHCSQYGLSQCYRRDHEGDALTLLPGDFDVVLMAWPPYREPLATNVARCMRPGQVLVYEGEGLAGCTASDAFFEEVGDTARWAPLAAWNRALAEHHLSFARIFDTWQAWRKL
jgi:SAM-dependent methyltransferase